MRVGRPSIEQVAGFVACSWLLAMVAIFAVQQVHQDLHEHLELPPILHWLRDAAVAVPLAALAIGTAALLVRLAFGGADPGGGAHPGRVRSASAWLSWAVIAAVTFAVFSIPGNQLHGLLFGAEEEPIGWLADALKDGSIVLVASLVALVPVALLGARASRFAESQPDGVQASGPAPNSLAGTSAFPSLAAPAPSGDDL